MNEKEKQIEELLENSKYAKKAMDLFSEGYNCSQSVVLAFQDMYNLDETTMAMLASSFGGGMGRLREVCGSVSGMFIVAGLLYGYSNPKAREEKADHYKTIQELAKEFEEMNHSIVCRDLLGIGKEKQSYIPEERTKEYYAKRPCKQLVGISAAIMEKYISQKNIQTMNE